MKVVICGPNLRDQSKGQFHVHAEGCADLKRSREPAYRDGWTVDVDNRVEVVEEVYADMLDDKEDPDATAREWLSDFHFPPCVDSLPTTSVEQDCPECGGALEPGGNGHAAECNR